MLFEGEKLDEYIEQIVQEQKEEEKMKHIRVWNYIDKEYIWLKYSFERSYVVIASITSYKKIWMHLKKTNLR